MSYRIYTTEALVCGNFLHNTADKTFLLFTRELGMIFANAKSVREERSKQRFSLQDFSLINVSLIKGKQGWRVGSVEEVENFYAQADTRAKRGDVVLIFKTLRRFIQGEGEIPNLFDFCVAANRTLIKKVEDNSVLANLIQLKILFELGYVDKSDTLDVVIEGTLSDILEREKEFQGDKVQAVIQKAITNSHL